MNKKTITMMMRVTGSLLVLLTPFMFFACGDDDGPGPLPPRPRIEFGNGNAISLERGQDTEVNVTLTAEGGFQSLTVNGDDLQFTVDANDNTSATATFPIEVADDADFGETVYSFVVTDNRDQEADADFTLTVIGSTVILGDITEDTMLEVENIYIFDTLEVRDATLTIPAGTRLYAAEVEDDIYSEFRVDDSGELIVEGTATNPVVFSSERALTGEAEPGDWIGLRINGEPESSSGNIQYIRVEYGGNDNAAIRLNDVDDLTTINHIQVFRSSKIDGAPAFELRGGNVNVSHLLITEAEGTSLNIRSGDDSYEGNLQFVIIQSSTFTEKKNDNNDDLRDFQINNNPDFTISNLTMIGSGAVPGDDDLNAVRFRNGEYRVYNSLIAEYSGDGLRVDRHTDITDINGNHIFAHSYIFKIGDDPTRDDQDSGVQPLVFETQAEFMNTINAGDTPTEAAGIGVADFVPGAAIPSSFDPTTIGDFFGAGSYVGAIGSTDWTLGWTLNADGTTRN